MVRENVKKKQRKGKGLNLILWVSFSFFAFLIVVIYALLQNVFTAHEVRSRTKEALKQAGRAVAEEISASPTAAVFLKRIVEIAGDYGVTFYLVYEDGASVYPSLTQESSYPDIVNVLSEQLQNKQEILFNHDEMISYGASLTLEGRLCYLLLESPSLMRDFYVKGYLLMSVITGLLSVVLAFAASGFVTMFITKPVTEVTEQAKELARGNFNLDFKNDYYCLELRELSAALERARQEISKSDVVQKELIANISHDFKTPLTMIKAYASMIVEISGDDKKKRDAHAQIIIDECDRLTALVSDVLDLSRLQAGVGLEQNTVFNLSEVVYAIAGRFGSFKQTEGYIFETDVEDEIYTRACRERIEQVLYNLIGNAVNYTGEDKTVKIKLYRKGARARFEVIDSGKGIPKDEIDTVWDRYYRSTATHKRAVSGSGLGLSIVKGILLAQKCPFGIISETGKGSCFWVEFSVPEQSGDGEERVE